MTFTSQSVLVTTQLKSVQVSISTTETRSLVSSWNGQINWGDNQVQDIPDTLFSSGIAKFDHTYRDDGWYPVLVRTKTVEYPNPLVVTETLQASINSGVVRFKQPPYVQGPIVASLTGYPSPDQWIFNVAQDSAYIQSGVYILLMTRKGERLMDPNFGTSLGALVFDPDTSVLAVRIQDEIQQAFRQYAQRVTLSSLTVQRDPEARAVHVLAGCKVNGQPFSVKVPFIS